MADFSYEDFLSWNDPNQGDPWNSPMPADTPGWEDFTGWGDPTGPGTSGDTSGGNWLSSLLSGGGQALSSLFGKGGAGGPLLSALGSLGGGAIGSNAANEASRLQSQALNRGLDISTAQWLQQQQNLAPYLQAGQGGLAQLQQLAGREQPGLPGQMASIDPRAYGMPDATPRWTPQGYQGPATVNAGDYRWNPQAGPQAANFRYAPGAVPTLSGQELLANDPGVQFRMDEGRKALEASAAAKGGLLSGPTLAALQRQGQELSSQEYGNAWNRASQQAQLREQWNQTASQLGFNQAQAEAAWREQMAQQSTAQNWTSALQGQQTGFNQGLESQKWLQTQNQLAADQLYNRNLEQYKLVYGQDVARNQTDYDRQQAAYRQQLAQHLLPWEQQSTLANLGGQATGLYGQQGQSATNAISNLLGQQGTAQAGGATNQANSWMNALQNIGNAGQGYLQNRDLVSALASLNR